MFKKSQDLSGVNDTLLSNFKNKNEAKKEGVGNRSPIEAVPNYIQADAEDVWSNNNSYIVLGRDRPSDRMSGYGGKGHTEANSIDIVVGRNSPGPRESNDEGEEVYVDPNFDTDAARIHLSQKTDIDDNFGLKKGKVGNYKARSGIGVKADGLRLMGREGIKLVTGLDESNSQGGTNLSRQGIDLMAGNDDSDMQPLVKGDNLKEALESIIDLIKELYSIVESFMSDQISYNSILAAHTHISPVGPTTPSPSAATSGIVTSMKQTMNSVTGMATQRVNTETLRINHLEPIGGKYINSEFNHTN